MPFTDTDNRELRDGFYVRKSRVYYVGKIVDSPQQDKKIGFVALSEQFPNAYIVPNDMSVVGYTLLARELRQIDEKRDSRMRRKGVREMKRTLGERLAAA